MTLTDTHLILLSAASQRGDGLLTPPAALAGAALQTLRKTLLRDRRTEGPFHGSALEAVKSRHP